MNVNAGLVGSWFKKDEIEIEFLDIDKMLTIGNGGSGGGGTDRILWRYKGDRTFNEGYIREFTKSFIRIAAGAFHDTIYGMGDK